MYLINDSSTTSKRSIWPEETRGLWVIGAWESKLQLSNGKVYDEWASALGANTLGLDRFHNGNCQFQPAASLPWQIEHDFSEEFCQAMGTEAVRLFKSGSDATSCAIRLARAYTGRPYIILFDKCYHGTGDSFAPIIWSQAGYLNTQAVVMPFGEEIKGGLVTTGQVAAIVVEPCPKAIIEPPAGWLQHLRQVCDEHGILLIADQVILGYRHKLRGYPGDDSVRYDLSCYGKAMAQGSAQSACTGRYDVMSLLKDKVHFSGTNNSSPLELHICRETLREYLEKDICSLLNAKGIHLKMLFNKAGIRTNGLNSRFEIEDWSMNKTKYCFEQGILFAGWASIAVSHNESQMTRLVEVVKECESING